LKARLGSKSRSVVCQMRFEDERIVAWCGGEFDVQIDHGHCRPGMSRNLQAGDELKFGSRSNWLPMLARNFGRIDVPVVLVVARPICAPISADSKAGRCVMATSCCFARPPGSPPPATAISSWTAPHDWVSPAKRDPTLRLHSWCRLDRFNASTLNA